VDFDSVSGFEIINHVGSGFFISMVKNVVFWVHVPLDLMNLVSTMRTVLSHDDCAFKLSVDKICIVSLAAIIY
jgi:hypothetical protein